MKTSIRNKILKLCLSGLILCAIGVGGFGIYRVNGFIEKHGQQHLELIAQGEGNRISGRLANIEQYVKTLAYVVHDGLVDIDMIAGPSEILIVADGKSNPRYVAADLLSQAEHDKLASAVLVTDSMDLALAVQQEIEVQLPQLLRAEIARVSVDNNGKIIVADNLAKAIEISNNIAPEHLELCVDQPFDWLDGIRHAGSVFLGRDLGHTRGYSEQMAALIDSEIKRLIDNAYSEAKQILVDHMDVLHASANLLLEKEKINQQEFEALFKNRAAAE